MFSDDDVVMEEILFLLMLSIIMRVRGSHSINFKSQEKPNYNSMN